MQVEVAVPLPILRTFTYSLPADLIEQAVPGARVLVPFGGRERIGWIERVVVENGGGSSRPITAVLDSRPAITPELLRLCRWAADYYFASLGLVLRAALPAALSATATQTIERVRPPAGSLSGDRARVYPMRDEDAEDPRTGGEENHNPAPETSTPDEPADEPTELERIVLDWLDSIEGPQSVTRLRRENGERAWWPVIRRLEEKGLVRVRSEPPRVEPAVRTRRVLRLTGELPTLRDRDEAFGRARRQRDCWEAVESIGGEMDVARLVGQGFSYPVLKGLVERGLARIEDEEIARDPYADIEPGNAAKVKPTPTQTTAIEELVRAARSSAPGTYLLRGVTGSGKTLVYIELLRELVDRQGRTAIVLVPEIALTPQTVGRFRAVFGDRVAVLHSGLSDGERYDEWRALRSGAKRIAVGARSAVFAPLPRLGAIIVDEEHEATYKQSEAPRYHARELAVVRASLEGAVCVLGSATPSLESWVNARSGKYRLIELPERATGQPLPVARVVDLRQERKKQRDTRLTGAGVVILSDELRSAMDQRLARAEQIILLLNRRGYANFVQCRDCGNVWDCPSCAVSLTFHRRRARLTCHYCLYEEETPTACERCGSTDISFRGIGTEQVERAVEEAFPSARLARMDVDTTSARWSHHKILDRVERGEVDILLGTQMIAKGLDFPNVTLVGVINADVGLNLPDFRATERTFQLITQVAGRAGRGPKGGEVIVQTSRPNHYAISCSLAHDFTGFAERELEARREPVYPPFSRLINVVVSGVDEIATQETAQRAADWLQGLAKKRRITELEIIGPAPAPIERIRDRWRWHVLIRSTNPAVIGRVGAFFAERFRMPAGKADLRLAIDRDPVALL